MKGRKLSRITPSESSGEGRLMGRGFGWLLLVFIASLGLWAWLLTHQTPTPTETPTPPPVDSASAADEDNAQQFFDNEVHPLLDECRQANKKAVEAFLERVEQSFEGYRAGVPAFAKDLMSFGTRFGVLWRIPVEWVKKESKVEAYVQEKFQKHVFSEKQLTNDLTRSFQHLREDLHANRNRLIANTKAAVAQADIPLPATPDFSGYEEDMRDIITDFSANRAKDSVYNGLITLLVSETGVLVVERIVYYTGAAIAASAANSAAAAGGTTAAATTTGGSAGALGGPVGTAIGVGVGFVVGIGIDWWMSNKFEAKLEKDMTKYLKDLEKGLIEGTEQSKGLRNSLQRFLNSVNRAEEKAMRKAIVEVSK